MKFDRFFDTIEIEEDEQSEFMRDMTKKLNNIHRLISNPSNMRTPLSYENGMPDQLVKNLITLVACTNKNVRNMGPALNQVGFLFVILN